MRRKAVVAVIADMVRSRALLAADRSRAQTQFSRLVAAFNRRYAPAIISKFVVTLGDEFQGLLSDAGVLPSLLFDIDRDFGDCPIRAGIGFGLLTIPAREYAINVDGPALHAARQAVQTARARRRLGGVFCGFGEFDVVLNGFARLARFQRSGMTERQLAVAALLREGRTQEDIGRRLRITRQAVSGHVNASGWAAYMEGENGWRAALKMATAGR